MLVAAWLLWIAKSRCWINYALLKAMLGLNCRVSLFSIAKGPSRLETAKTSWCCCLQQSQHGKQNAPQPALSASKIVCVVKSYSPGCQLPCRLLLQLLFFIRPLQYTYRISQEECFTKQNGNEHIPYKIMLAAIVFSVNVDIATGWPIKRLIKACFPWISDAFWFEKMQNHKYYIMWVQWFTNHRQEAIGNA